MCENYAITYTNIYSVSWAATHRLAKVVGEGAVGARHGHLDLRHDAAVGVGAEGARVGAAQHQPERVKHALLLLRLRARTCRSVCACVSKCE
jgi:hypothetical protein